MICQDFARVNKYIVFFYDNIDYILIQKIMLSV